jgi:hypothetical protein
VRDKWQIVIDRLLILKVQIYFQKNNQSSPHCQVLYLRCSAMCVRQPAGAWVPLLER